MVNLKERVRYISACSSIGACKKLLRLQTFGIFSMTTLRVSFCMLLKSLVLRYSEPFLLSVLEILPSFKKKNHVVKFMSEKLSRRFRIFLILDLTSIYLFIFLVTFMDLAELLFTKVFMFWVMPPLRLTRCPRAEIKSAKLSRRRAPISNFSNLSNSSPSSSS